MASGFGVRTQNLKKAVELFPFADKDPGKEGNGHTEGQVSKKSAQRKIIYGRQVTG